MTVSEKLKDLFTHMQQVKNLKFFDFIPPEQCNLLYMGMYGNRVLGKMAETKSIEEIAQVVVCAFGESWDNTVIAYTSSVKELGDYKETVTETVTDNGTTTNNNVVTGKVSAYNDDVFVNDDENTTKTDGTNTNERMRTYEINKMRNSNEYINAINYLKTNLFCDIIMIDINRLLTINIFN